MVAVCEAFELAESLHIDPQLVIDVCGTGAAGSWALSNLGPRIVRGDFGPGFMIKDMLKDLEFVDQSLQDRCWAVPGTHLAKERFEIAAKLDGPSGQTQGTQAMMSAYRHACSPVPGKNRQQDC
jgi:3-hydroxyisobutyrate dehydrogenase